jgi:hypothetical protein
LKATDHIYLPSFLAGASSPAKSELRISKQLLQGHNFFRRTKKNSQTIK